MEVEEIYDILMEQLVAAIRKCDPHYTAKVPAGAARSLSNMALTTEAHRGLQGGWRVAEETRQPASDGSRAPAGRDCNPTELLWTAKPFCNKQLHASFFAAECMFIANGSGRGRGIQADS
jgi:hypothetical protein